MTAGDRFKGWIEGLAESWKDRLRAWLGGVADHAVNEVGEQASLGELNALRDLIQKALGTPEVGPEIKKMAEEFMVPESGIKRLLAELFWILTSITSIIGGNSVFAREWQYIFDSGERSARLDPMSVITGWRRDATTFEQYFDDLRVQGWSEDRIEALKFITLFYPGPSDLVRFQAREVFEPEMIRRYGLDDEFEGIDLEPFRKAGMTDEVTRYYWRAHWEHASWMQVVEMLHRGQLTEAQVRDWFRLVEIPPFWRDKLIATSWNVPTRVDVRRFYDLKTIDEARLREIYTAMGYHGKDLDDYVLWTKIYVELPDLIARWKNGWITLDDARERLVELGMTRASAEELIQTKVKVEEPDDVTESKALTKAEIYKAVKQGKLTRAEGVELLVDLEYSEDKALLLLDINVPVDETDEVAEERKLSKSDVKTALALGEINESEARAKLAELRYSAANINLLIRIFAIQNKELAKADILSILKKAAITPDDAITRLVGLGYSSDDARLLIFEKEEPATVEKERQASKADIVEGVKKGIITPEEGYVMLTDIGYTPDASNFILTVKLEESPFSPINYSEFKDLTSRYKKVVGMEATPVPEELKQAADALVKVRLEVEALERAEKEERGKLTAEEEVPDSASATLKHIQVALNRARAELQRQQLAYNSLVARWKHGAI